MIWLGELYSSSPPQSRTAEHTHAALAGEDLTLNKMSMDWTENGVGLQVY